MASARARKALLEKLYWECKHNKFSKTLTYDEYVKGVESPITRRAVKQEFTNWVRLKNALLRWYPDAFIHVEQVKPINPLDMLKAKAGFKKTPEPTEEVEPTEEEDG